MCEHQQKLRSGKKGATIYGPNSLNLSSEIREDFKISSVRWSVEERCFNIKITDYGMEGRSVKASHSCPATLTHYRRHFALHQLGHGTANRYLQGRNVEGCHIVLAATFIIVVNDILSHIIIWSGIFYVRLASTAVHDEHEHQDCGCEEEGREKAKL